jgi:alpha-tubulin suppressor-like RCC1 family protein
VCTGEAFSCELANDGTVYCWGTDGNDELGNNLSPGNKSAATLVQGTTGVTAITCGQSHVCVLTGGTVQCWGSNVSGELGLSTATATKYGVAVKVPGLTGPIAIAAGEYFTCALSSDGTVHCWGNNDYGELGDNSGYSHNIPWSVTGLTNATAIAAGFHHACAILSDSTVECWGQLGPGGNTPTPAAVSGLTGVTAIAAGGDTCALTAGGTPVCWGANVAGDLGDWSMTASYVPVPVTGLTGVTSIAAAGSSFCAVEASGAIACWGSDDEGQISNGATTPVVVSGL